MFAQHIGKRVLTWKDPRSGDPELRQPLNATHSFAVYSGEVSSEFVNASKVDSSVKIGAENCENGLETTALSLFIARYSPGLKRNQGTPTICAHDT